ncbi:MAG: hypothetical protein V2B15_12490 [Bacteroidota bacterium]
MKSATPHSGLRFLPLVFIAAGAVLPAGSRLAAGTGWILLERLD